MGIGRSRGARTRDHDHVNVETYQVRRQVWETLELTLRIAVLRQEILAFHVPQRA
jgi:hypothetical protein